VGAERLCPPPTAAAPASLHPKLACLPWLQVTLSVIEIYLERIKDLLNPGRDNLRVGAGRARRHRAAAAAVLIDQRSLLGHAHCAAASDIPSPSVSTCLSTPVMLRTAQIQ
jgi:hypothetical protein